MNVFNFFLLIDKSELKTLKSAKAKIKSFLPIILGFENSVSIFKKIIFVSNSLYPIFLIVPSIKPISL